MGVKLTGVGQIKSLLMVVGSPAGARAVIAPPMIQSAEAMMTTSKRQTPVDTGALRASGRVTLIGAVGPKFIVELGYHTNYAAAVHEDLTAAHPVGKAKFLEDPVKAGVKAMERRIGLAIAASLKGSKP